MISRFHIRFRSLRPLHDGAGDSGFFEALFQLQVAGEGEGFFGIFGVEVVEVGEEGGEVVNFGLRFALGVVQGEGELLRGAADNAQQAMGSGEGAAATCKVEADASRFSGFRRLRSSRPVVHCAPYPSVRFLFRNLSGGGTAGQGGVDVGQEFRGALSYLECEFQRAGLRLHLQGRMGFLSGYGAEGDGGGAEGGGFCQGAVGQGGEAEAGAVEAEALGFVPGYEVVAGFGQDKQGFGGGCQGECGVGIGGRMPVRGLLCVADAYLQAGGGGRLRLPVGADADGGELFGFSGVLAVAGGEAGEGEDAEEDGGVGADIHVVDILIVDN